MHQHPLLTHTHTQYGDTALIWASTNGYRKVVVELLRAGARADVVNAVSQHGH